MRKALIAISILSLCFCAGKSFADNRSLPKFDDSTVVNQNQGSSDGGLVGAIERLDAWIKRNLW